jgi:SAM-dependent methyltransferase
VSVGPVSLSALDELKRLAADPIPYMAQRIGQLVRNTPSERLEQLMLSPARRPLLDGIFWQIPKQLNRDYTAGMTTTIRWCITGRADGGIDTYDLQVDRRRAWTRRNPAAGEPRLTITIDSVEFLRLASGNSDPMAAYRDGRISMRGDFTVATKLPHMFRTPGAGGASAAARDEDGVLSAGEPRQAAPPDATRDTRRELADEFLRGSGLEIGALHLRMAVPPRANVRYVDRMTVPALRAHYPELENWDLAPVEVVDDGERLPTIAPESVDFIIANHFLEHCEDPIRTIETHLGKLRPGGILFYAVPDKRYTFDFRRPRTPLSHVIADYENGPTGSRQAHYLEWARLVYEGSEAPDDEAARDRAAQLESEGYSIHFHVWTQADLMEVMVHCHERLGTFEVVAVREHSLEVILVLRKNAHCQSAAGADGDSNPPIPSRKCEV